MYLVLFNLMAIEFKNKILKTTCQVVGYFRSFLFRERKRKVYLNHNKDGVYRSIIIRAHRFGILFTDIRCGIYEFRVVQVYISLRVKDVASYRVIKCGIYEF
jgi:hypothetical protein